MKPAVARVARLHFFVVFLGIVSAVSFGSWAWPYTLSQNQKCSGNCENLEMSAPFAPNKKLDAQSIELSSASDIRTITPGSTLSVSDQGATTTPPHKNPATEGGSIPGPGFFLLVGSTLIGLRLVISYRSRKLKNLATETR
jgi:hypothetical protein